MKNAKKFVTLLVGDSLLIEEAVKKEETALKQNLNGELDVQIFQLGDISMGEVLSRARTLPFLAKAQLFRIRNLSKFKKNDTELLSQYLESPSQVSFLFFEDRDLSKTSDIAKLIKKSGTVHFFDSHEEKSVVKNFIRQKLKSANKTIEPQGAHILEHAVGAMPSLLDTMLERLILYAGNESKITVDMVRSFEEEWTQNDIFTMTNAIADKKTGYALELLKKQFDENGEDVIGLIGILHWQIRRLWLMRVLADEGAPQAIIQKKCGVSSKQLHFLMRDVKRFSRNHLEKTLEELFLLDWKIKSGRTEGPTALESWVVEVTAK